MGRQLVLAEKPSVGRELARVLGCRRGGEGYLEGDRYVVTWALGHLVTLADPDVYEKKWEKWDMADLPMLPQHRKLVVIPQTARQFRVVQGLMKRSDITGLIIATDAGREGELVARWIMAKAGWNKPAKRLWISSQTDKAIRDGFADLRPAADYDNLFRSAQARSEADWLVGLNVTRALTCKYNAQLSAGRVQTPTLALIAAREREIRSFVKTPFYRVLGSFDVPGREGISVEAEWKAVKGSRYYETPVLYKENGFKEKKTAEELIRFLSAPPMEGTLVSMEKKRETKNAPLLYNLAEFQNDCSKMFKISPDEALKVVQELYEKKLVTYPRTDARVLSSAVAKEIHKNIGGLRNFAPLADLASEALELGSFKTIGNTRYVNDKQITDHYAIIPTGQGFGALRTLGSLQLKVYEVISRRFLSIFYPAAIYQKYSLVLERKKEQFFASFKVLSEPGYLKVADVNLAKKSSIQETFSDEKEGNSAQTDEKNAEIPKVDRTLLLQVLADLKKNDILTIADLKVKEGETSPPKRYTSGSMILAMENAGQLIEDEELRAQIKGSGIGTSATRAEILKKLFNIKYLALNKKTQVITPTLLGEMIYDVVLNSIRSLLNPELTASWEKGLNYVAEGEITSDEYMTKLDHFIVSRTNGVLGLNNQYQLRSCYDRAAVFYKKETKGRASKGKKE